ncbi:MAG: hypothetical protein WCT04_08765 [Planctomycetota bacterium]
MNAPVFSTLLRTVRFIAFAGMLNAASWAAEQPQLSVDDQEQLDVQRDVFWLSITMWVLVIGLLVLAYSIRYIAKRTTRPCRWCSEFISKKACVCPRCGHPLDAPQHV